MGSISEKLEYLNETKTQIKTALTNKGVAIADTDTFRSYADKITNLKTAPTLQAKSQTITTNTTTTITPDSGYDGLKSVSITTNIPSSNLVSNSKFIYDFAPDTAQTWTVPATVTYAIITVITTYHSTGATAVSGTPTCTASKGTLSVKHNTKYEKNGEATRPYVWTLTNTTGTASTITVKADYKGANYGEIWSFASIVY